MNNIEVIVNQQPGEIQLNYEDIKMMLQEKLEVYKGAVVTEDGKTIAKKEVAYLRKLKKEIDDRRKEVKKTWNEPYDAFASKVSALLAMIDEPILLIDRQVKAFDEKQKEEKREKIRELYGQSIGELEAYLPWEKMYQHSWENVSVSMKKVSEEMQAKIDAVKRDIETIQSMQSEAVPEALEIYRKSLEVTSAIQHINRYEQQKKEILEREQKRKTEEEERRRQAELEKAREEERERIAEEERIRREAAEQAAAKERERIEREREAETAGFQVDSEMDEELPFEQPSTKTVFYKIVATPEELEQVEMTFNSLGIYFARREA